MIKRDETGVVVVARFMAKEGKEQELLETLQLLMGPTHQEPDCLRYELNQNVDNPRMITYIEKFKSRQAFETHKESPYIRGFFQNVAPGLVEQQDVTLHQEILP